MKSNWKIFLIAAVALVLTSLAPAGAHAQDNRPTKMYARSFRAGGSSPWLSLISSGVAYSQVCWNITGGTLTAAQVKIEQSSDKGTPSDLGTYNSSAANGCGPLVAGSPNYIRVTVHPTYTVNTLSPILNVTYGGWRINPTLNGFTTDALFCGQQANNGTIYMGPASGFASGGAYADTASFAIGGAGCDALDSATEATADAPLWTNNAIKVLGMTCKVSGSGANGVAITLRSAAADVAPTVTVTIPTATTTAATNTATTTNIAAGATMAIKVVNTEDLSAEDAWCLVKIQVVP